MVDNERLTVSKKEFFVRVLAVLNTSYVAVCALLNMNGSLSILGLSSKILMIILSIVGVGVLLVYYVNNRKQMDRSVKTLVFTSLLAPIIWNIIIMVSFFVK